MSAFKDRGIVLKEEASGEYDKNLTVLLENYGKTKIFAKGAKNPKSKIGGACALFAYSDFVIFDGGAFRSLAQAQLIDNFYNIRNDYDCFCRACFMLELSGKLIQTAPGEALGLLVKTFGAFCKNPVNQKFVFCVYLFTLLRLEGYMPELFACSVCRRENLDKALFFSETGLICGDCLTGKQKYFAIDNTALSALQYIYSAETDKLYTLNAKSDVLDILTKLALFLLEYNFEIDVKSGALL